MPQHRQVAGLGGESHEVIHQRVYYLSVGLDRVGLDRVGLDWVGLGLVGLGWVGLDWVGLVQLGLARLGSAWVSLGWLLGWFGLGYLHAHGCFKYKPSRESQAQSCKNKNKKSADTLRR